MLLPKIVASLITFQLLLTISINQVHADLGDAQNGTVGGSDGGYTNGSGASLGGGSYDPSNGNNSQDAFGSDFSSNGNDTSNSFAEMISEAFGLGNEAGTIGGAGGLNGPLSNMNATLDQQGVTASYDLDNDPCLQTGFCPHPAPVLNATASCSGNQPVVNLSWAGVPQPSSTNGGLGSQTLLIRSSLLQTALPVTNAMRIFPFAAMGYGTNSYTDTTRQYWRPAYTIPGSTEVTSTDENGTPTGTIENPPVNVPAALVLTHTVNPSTFYYYRIYSTNASGAQIYKSELQGMTYDFSYTARTPVSNIMAVYTPACTGVVTPQPSPTPSPTGSSVPTPTPTGNLSLVSNSCVSGGGSTATFNLSSSSPGVTSYHLDKDGVYVGSGSPANPIINISMGAGQSATFTSRFQSGAGIFPGTGNIAVSAASCVPTVKPIVNFTITTPRGTFPYGGLPVSVKQTEPVTLNWQIEFADWVTASGSPARSDWTGALNKVSGSQSISTVTEGNYVLGLNAGNSVGTAAVSIQLNILRTPAYIQTTGGDVHTNEDIFITPNN